MKNVFLIFSLLLLLGNALKAQLIEMDYFPEYSENIDQASYDRGRNILINSYEQISDHENPNYVDYWNVAVGLAYMCDDKSHILGLLEKSKNMNQENFCIVLNFQIESKDGDLESIRLHQLLGDDYNALISQCIGYKNEAVSLEERRRKMKNRDLSGLNTSLIERLIVLLDKDQRYRYSSKEYDANVEAQSQLDGEVNQELCEIFNEFAYPGKSIVGEFYMDYACLLLEHCGNLESYEKYLPLVAEAFIKGELNAGPFKMLIDRIYWRTTGKQVFGSHVGQEFHSDDEILRVRKKYGLE